MQPIKNISLDQKRKLIIKSMVNEYILLEEGYSHVDIIVIFNYNKNRRKNKNERERKKKRFSFFV